jgi:hypothetical protein
VNVSPKRREHWPSIHCARRTQSAVWSEAGIRGPGGSEDGTWFI